MMPVRPPCLASAAIKALGEADISAKCAATRTMAEWWATRQLSLVSSKNLVVPDRPGRPDKPELVTPHKVPRRNLRSQKGMIAVLHSIAHIELNAIDLALDIIARFAGMKMPRSFFDGWVMVAFEEAKHFQLIQARLADFGAKYGDLPAHGGLWESAKRTGHDLTARLAIVPLVLEARGLDVTPSLIEKMMELGDEKTADIFRIIYEDEKGHVGVGAKWFRFLCHKQGLEPAQTFRKLVNEHFRGPLKPPFNELARAKSGITPLLYRSLSPLGR